MWDGSTYLEEYISLDDLRIPLSGLLSQDVPIALHNSKFDYHFFEAAGISFSEKIFDTLLAAQLLNENRSNGLKDLAYLVDMSYDKYMKHKKYAGFKNEEILGGTLIDVATYAVNDVRATWKLYLLFKEQLQSAKELRSENLYRVFTDIWIPLSHVLRKMETRGVHIDREKTQALLKEYSHRALVAKNEVLREGYKDIVERSKQGELPGYYAKQIPDELSAHIVEDDTGRHINIFGINIPVFRPTPRSNERFYEFNPASPKQMNALIYGNPLVPQDTEVPLKFNPSGDSLAVDKENLKIIQYYMKDETPAYIQSLLDWKESEKFVSTYLENFLVRTTDDDPRIHCSFNQAVNDQGTGGTVTGRLSCNNPNLMNLPSRGDIGDETRSLIVPEEGHVLIAADYNNFEMRVLGHYSQDEVIMKAFSEGLDLHIAMGAKLMNFTYEDLYERYSNGDPEARKTRSLGKTVNFASAYGIGPTKLRRFILVNNEHELTQEETIRWLEEYDDLYSGAKKWKKVVSDFVRNNGYVVTIGGRLRRLPDGASHDRQKRSYAERQGINTIIQGSCGDIICEAMVSLQPTLEALRGSMLLQVHDELLSTVPVENVELAKELIEITMAKGSLSRNLRIPLVVEAKEGYNWHQAKG